MTNDIFCVGLTRTELQTLGTLLSSPDGSMCALRGRQPGQPNVRAVLRHSVPYKGLPPCDACASIPAHFAAETVCWCRPFPSQSLKIPYL